MTYFKFDIPKVNNEIRNYKNNKKRYLESVDLVYRNLGYTESAWNDSNAYVFMDKVKKDKTKLNNYFYYFDNLYNEIEQFKNNLNDICSKYGYRRDSIVLKFDDGELEDCKRYINRAINLFDNCLYAIDLDSFDDDFEHMELVKKIRSEIKILKQDAKNIINDINNISNSINNELYNSKFRLKRVGKYNFDLQTVNYNYKLVDLDLKK